MAQEHWGRPEELQRGRGDPPQLGRPPPQRVAEAAAEEEVRGGGEVRQGGKLGWGAGAGPGAGSLFRSLAFLSLQGFRAYPPPPQ